jgi:hypothetical protein
MDQVKIDELANLIGVKTIAGKEALVVALDNIKLLDTKQLDYGPHNISAFGLFGCIVRMNDKVERFKNLENYGKEQKAALKRLQEVLRLFDKDWHKLNLIQTLDHLENAMTNFKVLFAKKRKPVVNEKLRDTFKDIANYAVIALLLDSGKWPLKED